MVDLFCEYCGESFERDCKTDHGRAIRFCSQPCIHLARTPCGTPWTVNHTALLLAVAANSTDAEAAELLGRSKKSITVTRRKFGLRKPSMPGGVPFTEGEDTMLVDFYPLMSTLELAQLMGRTRCSVESRAKKLGLSKSIARLIEAHRTQFLLPRNVRDLIALNKKLKKGLRDEEHRRSASKSVR